MTRERQHASLSRSPRDLPAYSISETSHYLGIPTATIRSWVRGRSYPTGTGPKRFQPVIDVPDGDSQALSFVNLVEAHVLGAIRREHRIPLHKVRSALRFVTSSYHAEHPLANQQFETDGLDLFVEKLGDLINVSQEGQFAIRTLLEAHLRRIDRDSHGLAVRLYPFTRTGLADEPRIIVIDPLVSFGRPVLVGTGIATSVIAERYKGGETMDALAGDYGRQRQEIEEAIRCELQLSAA